MNWILLTALAAATPAVPTPAEIAADLRDEVQTGTLLFSQGDCLAIRVYTQSRYTHVAAVVVRDGKPLVYDSMNGAGVRRQTLDRYVATIGQDELHVYHPKQPFSRERARAFHAHLEEQIGRPYAIKHHLTGKRSFGVHCSEYVTDALIESHLLAAKRPAKVSPASLVAGIEKAGVYRHARTIPLRPPDKPAPEDLNWCEKLWFDTKLCTANCCAQMQRWFLCR